MIIQEEGLIYFTVSKTTSEVKTHLKKWVNVKESCFFSVANECLSSTFSSIFLITGRLIAARSKTKRTHSAYSKWELIIPNAAECTDVWQLCLMEHMLHSNQVMTSCSVSEIILNKNILLQQSLHATFLSFFLILIFVTAGHHSGFVSMVGS